MSKILVVGSSNIDFNLSTPYVPAMGETLVSEGKYGFTAGGKGANTAAAVSLMGGDAYLCSRVGDDAYGDNLIRIFKDKDINSKFVKVDKFEQTGLAAVMVENNGANRIIAYPGANLRISDTDVEEAFECNPNAVITQFEIRQEAVITAAKNAAHENIPFFVDGGSVKRGFPVSKLEKVEVFTPNEVETEILTGIRPDGLENCLRASIALCNMVDIGFVVLKLGSRGCFVYDGKYCDIVPPYVVDVVDTTAAGDVFTGALTVKYLETKDMLASAKFANAAAALTVSKRGAMASIPTLEEVENLLNA